MLRWLWRVLVGRPEPGPTPEAPPPEPLEAQLVTLRTRIAALELEWSETLDKIQRWTARQNALKRKATARALDEGPSPEAGGAEFVVPEGSQGHPLSRKQQLRQLAQQRGLYSNHGGR